MSEEKEKQKTRTNKHTNIIILMLFSVLFVLASGTLKFNNSLHWDEAVYTAMSMNLINENSGFTEILRPITLPFLTSICTRLLCMIKEMPLNTATIITAKILSAIFCFMFLVMFTHIAQMISKIIFKSERFVKISSIISFIMIISLSPFYFFALDILTSIPGITMLFIAILLIKKDRYFLAGIFSAFAFMLRYPFGLYMVAININIIIMIIIILLTKYSIRDSVKRCRLKLFKNKFIELVKFNIAFALTQMPLMIYNYKISTNTFSKICITDALSCKIKETILIALYPMISASNTVAELSNQSSFWYYLKELVHQQPLLILFPLGMIIFLLACKKILTNLKKNNYSFESFDVQLDMIKNKLKNVELLILIMMLFIITFVYFSNHSHKEIRYALSFTPFLIILCSIGLTSLVSFVLHNTRTDYVKISEFTKKYFDNKYTQSRFKKNIAKLIVTIIIIGVVVWISNLYLVTSGIVMTENKTMQYTINYEDKQYLIKLLDTNLSIMTTTPMIIEFSNSKIVPNYNQVDEFIKEFSKEKYEFLIISIPLEQSDLSFNFHDDESIRKIGSAINSYNVVYAKIVHNEKWIVLSKNKADNNSTSDMVDFNVLEPYLESSIIVAPTPFNDKIVMFRLDATGDKNLNGSMHNKAKIYDIIKIAQDNKINFTIAVIPKRFDNIIEEDKTDFTSIVNDSDIFIEIAQNGIDFVNKGLSEQTDLEDDISSQIKHINESKIILENYFGNIYTFIPAFNNGNSNTIKAIDHLGFTTYSSSKWDYISSEDYHGIYRLDIDTFMIEDWVYKKYKTTEDLMDEVNALLSINNHAMIEMYILDEEDKDIINLFDELSTRLNKENCKFYTIKQYSEWKRCYENIELVKDEINDAYTIKAPEQAENSYCEGITILANKDIDLNLENMKHQSIYVNNINKNKDIVVCTRNCSTIKPGQMKKY